MNDDEQKDDRTADLAAAFEDAEEELEQGDGENTDDETIQAQEAVDQGQEETGAGDAEEVHSGDSPQSEVVEGKADDAPSVDEPPSSLPPEAREVWKDAPAALKAAVAKREKDFEAGIMKYSADAKRAQGMDQTLEPYRQYLDMNGGPGQAIQGLLQTGATLQMGSPQQKAPVLSSLIQQFSVDIPMLDQMLTGSQPQPSQNPEVADLRQRLDQMQQGQQQAAQQRQQQTQQDIAAQIQAFASDSSNEFYNDVRGDMANYMDVKTNNGESPTLKEAYNFACQMRPDIKAIIDGRASQGDVDRKRAAASSLKGGPSGPGQKGPKDDSIRASLEYSFENAGQV